MVKRQRQKGNLESSKGEEATHHVKVILNKINRWLILGNYRGQKAIRLYIKSAERKRMSTKNSIYSKNILQEQRTTPMTQVAVPPPHLVLTGVDPSSPGQPQDQIQVEDPHVEAQWMLNHWTTREVPVFPFFVTSRGRQWLWLMTVSWWESGNRWWLELAETKQVYRDPGKVVSWEALVLPQFLVEFLLSPFLLPFSKLV